MGWELVVNGGKNLSVLLVGAMVMTSLDIRQLVRNLIHQAKMEQRSLQDMVDEEVSREQSDKEP